VFRFVSDTKETSWDFGPQNYEPEGREFESPRAHHQNSRNKKGCLLLGNPVRLWLVSRLTLDIYVHATYYVIPLRLVGFWLLMGAAAVWFVIAVYKFGRYETCER
jgi:hypothetical protein